MKKVCCVLILYNFCLSNDPVDDRRIEFQNKFNDTIDEYIINDCSWRVIRSLPFCGQVIDFGYCMQRKLQYHRLFSTDVSTQDQWNDYITRLKQNEEKLHQLSMSLFIRTIIDCGITISAALTNIGLLYAHNNDYHTHIFVYMYAIGTLMRVSACGTILWEKYRISRNFKSNPRFKVIHLFDQPNADAEELLNTFDITV